jgi:hypothetical protein
LINDRQNELYKWSFSFAICTYPFLDSIKFVAHGNNKNYGGIYTKPKGLFETIDGDFIKIKFDKSSIEGRYPYWNINAFYENKLKAKLKITAISPAIWILRNTGFNSRKSIMGYYSVMNCDASGEISIYDKEYKIKGIAYYDHMWAPYLFKKNNVIKQKIKNIIIDLNVWDWLFIRLENGWNIFIGKLHSISRNNTDKIIPGIILIQTDFYTYSHKLFFYLEYIDYKLSAYSNKIKIPKKILIKVNRIKIQKGESIDIKIIFNSESIKEMPIGGKKFWLQSESRGHVNCKINNNKNVKDVKGWAIMENTNQIL